MDERVYYNLRLAIVGVYVYENILEWSPEDRYLMENLKEEVDKNKLRFKEIKFF